MRRGKIEGAVVYTERDEETVRIVSARWATKRETDLSSIPASLGVTTTWNSTRSAGGRKEAWEDRQRSYFTCSCW